MPARPGSRAFAAPIPRRSASPANRRYVMPVCHRGVRQPGKRRGHRSLPYLRRMWIATDSGSPSSAGAPRPGRARRRALVVGRLALELPPAREPLRGRACRRRARPAIAQPGSPVVAAVPEPARGGDLVDVLERGRRGRRRHQRRRATRMPGVSMSSAPPGSRKSSRRVVVWRPRVVVADRGRRAGAPRRAAR